MIEELHEFQLPLGEWEYLHRLASTEDIFFRLLGAELDSGHESMTVRLDRQGAEKLRELLTTRLAEVGFDENYSANNEGVLLESIIDRFYLSAHEQTETGPDSSKCC